MNGMRIYISGKITGLPYEEAFLRFSDVEALLEAIDFEVVNPMKLNADNKDGEWRELMEKDIAALLHCDAIYMMDNWTDSVGASIEYDIASRLGLDIYFESAIRKENKAILAVRRAVHEVTGLQFREFTTKSRKQNCFFARLLFIYHCRKRKVKFRHIAALIHRDHSTTVQLLNKYEKEYRYNPQFREMADSMEMILNEIYNK